MPGQEELVVLLVGVLGGAQVDGVLKEVSQAGQVGRVVEVSGVDVGAGCCEHRLCILHDHCSEAVVKPAGAQ